MNVYWLNNLSQHVSRKEAQLGALAIQLYANSKICPAWGWAPIAVVADDEAPTVAHVRCDISDAVDDSSAFAWHTEDGGVPLIFDQVGAVLSAGGTALSANGSISVMGALLHEIAEDLADQACNRLVLTPGGRLLAFEPADPVQMLVAPQSVQDGSKLVNVDLSDVVLPSYYDPQNTCGPYDVLGHLTIPFEKSPHGYLNYYLPAKGSWTSEWGARVPVAVRAAKERSRRLRQRRQHGRTLGRYKMMFTYGGGPVAPGDTVTWVVNAASVMTPRSLSLAEPVAAGVNQLILVDALINGRRSLLFREGHVFQPAEIARDSRYYLQNLHNASTAFELWEMMPGEYLELEFYNPKSSPQRLSVALNVTLGEYPLRSKGSP